MSFGHIHLICPETREVSEECGLLKSSGSEPVSSMKEEPGRQLCTGRANRIERAAFRLQRAKRGLGAIKELGHSYFLDPEEEGNPIPITAEKTSGQI